MLAVVQNDQEPLFFQREDQSPLHWLAGLLFNPQHVGHSAGDKVRLGEGGQLDKPDAVAVAVQKVGGDLQRQARFCRCRRPRSASRGAFCRARL